MNWTGGKLQRHCKQGKNTELNKKQKDHFSRARQLRRQQESQSTSNFDPYLRASEHSHRSKFSGTGPNGQRSRPSSIVRTSASAHATTPQHYETLNDTGDSYTECRQRLLDQPDWLDLDVTRPLTMSFPEDRSKEMFERFFIGQPALIAPLRCQMSRDEQMKRGSITWRVEDTVEPAREIEDDSSPLLYSRHALSQAPSLELCAVSEEDDEPMLLETGSVDHEQDHELPLGFSIIPYPFLQDSSTPTHVREGIDYITSAYGSTSPQFLEQEHEAFPLEDALDDL